MPNRLGRTRPWAISRRSVKRGVTLIQGLVVLSTITTLLILSVPAVTATRQQLFEAQCRSQLANIGAALVRFGQDHHGQEPPVLSALVPEYLSENELICPLVMARAPEAVSRAKAVRATNPGIKYWFSYFYYERRRIDRLYTKGRLPLGYTQVMSRRKGDTPVVACLDHREPFSLRYASQTTPAMLESWYFPERPVLVLRRGHRVDATHYGGVYLDGLQPDTLAQLTHF